MSNWEQIEAYYTLQVICNIYDRQYFQNLKKSMDNC